MKECPIAAYGKCRSKSSNVASFLNNAGNLNAVVEGGKILKPVLGNAFSGAKNYFMNRGKK